MNVLFVCTGNTCRSPMAAGLFNKIAIEKNLDVRIDSAGLCTYEGETASEGAILAMKDYEVDLTEHRSKNLTKELLEVSDIILTMTKSHKSALSAIAGDKVYTLSEYAGMDEDIADPYGGSAEVYKMTANQIEKALLKIAEKISHLR